MALDEATLKELAKQFGLAVAQSAVIYAPAIQKMTMAELIAFGNLLNQKRSNKAYMTLAAKMTVEELASEKVALAELVRMRADESASAQAMAKAILTAILQAALTLAIGLVGL
jgi:hypothetical protein